MPDRGSTFLGGINRSRSFSRSSGVPLLPGGNRARRSFSSAAQVSAHVWIHDLEAMDQAILSQGVSQPAWVNGQLANRWPADARQNALGKQADSKFAAHLKIEDSGVLSVVQHRNRADEAKLTKTREAKAHIAKAQQAEEAGKLSLARTYYRLAQRRADEPLRQTITERLLALETSSHAKKPSRRTVLAEN